jgi:hypothetical protein
MLEDELDRLRLDVCAVPMFTVTRLSALSTLEDELERFKLDV